VRGRHEIRTSRMETLKSPRGDNDAGDENSLLRLGNRAVNHSCNYCKREPIGHPGAMIDDDEAVSYPRWWVG